MPVCSDGTAAKLFECIYESLRLRERSISWVKVVAFESDTANVIIGKHNSVLSRVKENQPHVYTQRCVCHLANLTLLAKVKALPVDVDDFLWSSFIISRRVQKERKIILTFYRHKAIKNLKALQNTLAKS